MPDKRVLLKNLGQAEKFAKNLSKKIEKGDVLAFYGDLGSGKTTFINFLAKSLGIKRRLISPTFVILKSYKKKDFIFNHADLYRINSEREIVDTGLPELLSDRKSITAIEWAEKMEKYLPRNTIRIYMRYIDQDTREIRIK